MTALSFQPESPKSAHLIGICGSGMKALAQALLEVGIAVSGSDMDEETLKLLAKKGATVHHGHAQANLGSPDVIVYSTAIPDTNPELAEARRRGIPCWHRSMMLGWFLSRYESILVAGTHGKTTTTTMVSLLLLEAGLDPWSFVGGFVREFHGNSRTGGDRYAVAEADESDGSFLILPRAHAIIMNVEDEHLNYWETSERMFEGFREFASGIPSDGILALCADDPGTRKLATLINRRIVWYSAKGTDAAFQAVEIKLYGTGSEFTLRRDGVDLGRVKLAIPGMQNVANATGAFALAISLGVSFAKISAALSAFAGVDRRFTKFEAPGGVLVIDDYGHHPTEIRVTVEAARRLADERGGRLVTVFQPHRYTRTQSFMQDFGASFQQADELILTEIYSSGEAPIPGVTGSALAEIVSRQIPGKTAFIPVFEDIKKSVKDSTKNGDIVLLLGAGTVTKLVNLLISPAR